MTPTGPDSPHFKDGQHVRVPGEPGKRMQWPTLAELKNRALTDPDLFRFQQDAALLEAMKQQITIRLEDTTKLLPPKTAVRLMSLIELLGRTREREIKRLRDMQLTVPAERHIAALRLIGEVQNQVLMEVQAELHAAIDAGKTGDELKRLVDGLAWLHRITAAVRVVAIRQSTAFVIDLTKEPEGGKH